MSEENKLLAWAQIGLSVFFIFGVFVVIILYETGLAHFANADQEKSFGSTLNWLTGAAAIIVYFWFQRQRTGGIPSDGNVVTQTHVLPDGTKTTITSPVNAPRVPTFASKVMNVPTLNDSVK
jgi:hypothetical protein